MEYRGYMAVKEVCMKKHLIVISAIVLVAAIVGAVVYVVISAMNRPDDSVDQPPTEAAAAPATEAATLYSETFKIGIIQHGLGNASKDCYEGFITELNERGLLNNLEIVYIVEDDEELCRAKIQELVDSGCDLLYTIGRFASEAAAKITTDVPIIFGAVGSPDAVGLVESNEVPGGNVTGVSSYTPCFEQIDLIEIILPEAKTLAAIYSATDENAVMQGIIASREAENIGVTCERYPVESKEALKTTLDKIKEAKTDVIYMPVDKFLSANIAEITAFSYENKIPVICGDEATLAMGAFATSEINYSSIGRKAAGMACDVLFEKKDISTLSVVYKHDCTNLVNRDVRDKLGVQIPATALGEIEFWTAPTEPPAQAETTVAP